MRREFKEKSARASSQRYTHNPLYDAKAKVASSVSVLRQAELFHGGGSWKIVTDAIAPIEQVLRQLLEELTLDRTGEHIRRSRALSRRI